MVVMLGSSSNRSGKCLITRLSKDCQDGRFYLRYLRDEDKKIYLYNVKFLSLISITVVVGESAAALLFRLIDFEAAAPRMSPVLAGLPMRFHRHDISTGRSEILRAHRERRTQ